MNKKKQKNFMNFVPAREITGAPLEQKFFAELFYKKATAYLFLFCAGLTGLGLALFTPIGQVPDEPTHIARADGLLYGRILGYPTLYQPPAGGQVEILSGVTNSLSVVKASVSELWETWPDKPLPPAVKAQARAVTWDTRTTYRPCNMDEYMPALYVPAAVGIAVGKGIGLSPLHSLYAGRIAMLCSFLAMGFAALRLARFGRPLIFALLTLPMTLCLAGSFNLDGQMLGAAILAAALLTRVPERAAWLGGLVCLALVTSSKPPYMLLLLLALVPLGAPFLLRRAVITALFGLAPLAWVALMFRYSYTVWYRPAYHPGPLWPGSPGILLTSTSVRENLYVLLARPAEILRLPLQFLVTDWHALWMTILGVFGWGPVQLTGWEYAGWVVALAAAALGCLAGPVRRVRRLDAGFIAAVLFASMIAMELALYLTWTDVGKASIDGINGRYFLLFPPFLVLMLPGLGGRLARLEAWLALPAMLLAVMDIYTLPALLLRTYQMGWP